MQPLEGLFFLFFTLFNMFFRVLLRLHPLKTTCAGTPTFQRVADVVSARSIRSLRWFPHFNYNTTWSTDVLISAALTGNEMLHARRRERRSEVTEAPAAPRPSTVGAAVQHDCNLAV